MNFIEKRQMDRYDFELPALLSMMDANGNQRAVEVIISNICAGGALFKTDHPLSVGTDVKMDLILTSDKFKKFETKRSRVHVSGSVIRMESQRMAVCFDKNFKISPLNT